MDTTAPSLLWATQLRHENIHLSNTMSEYKAILTSATNTIEALGQTVNILTARIQALEEHRVVDREETHTRIDLEVQGREHERGEGEVSERVGLLEEGSLKVREEVKGLGNGFEEVKGRIGGVVEKVEGLKTLRADFTGALDLIPRLGEQNREMKERICVLERECSVQGKQVGRALNWMSMRTMGEERKHGTLIQS